MSLQTDSSKPFVVACIPAYEEESIGGVVVRVMSGDALNKWPRSFMAGWGMP